MPLVIKTAAQIAEPEGEARWAARRTARESPVFRAVLRRFAEAGGPVSAADLATALPAMPPGDVARALAALDTDDLLVLRDGAVELAYPFSTAPTGFVVRWRAGVERFICCAIDALGMAPMLGEAVQVAASCHQTDAPLSFAVTPDGPAPAAAGLMVWVTPAGGGEDRACTGL